MNGPRNTKRLRLSILDATPIGPGVVASQAFKWAAELARMAEIRGFYRFWVTEHHCVPDIGCSAPAVLLAHLASITSRLRLGAGGVMLPNHAPLVVAEQFRMLEALCPGRIDLGIGRASGANGAAVQALRRHTDSNGEFTDELEELQGFLSDKFPEGHLFENIEVSPKTKAPPIFILGSSERSAEMAAGAGLPFAFAHHLNPDATRSALTLYREKFLPSRNQTKPYCIATIAVVSASSHEIAKRAALGALITRIRTAIARKSGIRASSVALRYPGWSSEEQELAEKQLEGGWIRIGEASRVAHDLVELSQTVSADELMLTTVEYDGPDRIRTLETIATAASNNETLPIRMETSVEVTLDPI